MFIVLTIVCSAITIAYSLSFVVPQSSGKSSVLESVVGKDFLPRGSGNLSH